MIEFPTDQLWRFALAAVPLAVLVAAACRWLPCRPSTRHTLWLMLLVLIVVAPFLPRAPIPDLTALRGTDPAPVVLPTPPARTPDDYSITLPRTDAPRDEPQPDAVVSLSPADAPPAADPRRPRPATLSSTPRPRTDTYPDRAPPAETPRRSRGARPAATGPMPSSSPLVALPPIRSDLPPLLIAPRLPVLPEGVEIAASASEGDAVPALAPIVNRPTPDSREIPVPSLAATAAVTADPGGAPVRAKSPFGAPPGPPVAAAVEPSAPGAWRAWLTQLGAIRDAVMSLPPIPVQLWAGGAIFLALLTLFRIACFRRLLRSSEPAPTSAVLCVTDAADALGLAVAPATRMVNERISPMVWCGPAPCLILPSGLWAQLDETGRRAVVYHELAHLRRRDHWVCWVGMVVGWLYWWHPVVWWIRRRLREEADLCCDAWVTTLMPSARRAYATALLETKKFTSHHHPAVPSNGPVVGLGVTSIRTRRFARRITMVMTQQLTPRLTVGGIVLVGTMAVASWLVTPAIACPPDEKAEQAKVEKSMQRAQERALRAQKRAERKHAEARMRLKLASPPKPPKAPLPPRAPKATTVPDGYDSTFERFMRDRDKNRQGHGDGASIEGRIERLETEIETLAEHIAQWAQNFEVEFDLSEFGDMAKKFEVWAERFEDQMAEMDFTDLGDLEELPAIARKLMEQYEQYEQKGPQPPHAEHAPHAPDAPHAPHAPLAPHAEHAPHAQTDHGPASAGCCIGGTASCECIGGSASCECAESVVAYKLPKGKLGGLTELMIRADVPVFVSPQDDNIEVHGTAAQQRVFAAFVRMIAPEAAPPPPTAPPVSQGWWSNDQDDLARVYEEKAKARLQEIVALATELRHLEVQADEQSWRSDNVRTEAEAIMRMAEKLAEEAEKLEEASLRYEGEAHQRALDRVQELLHEAAEMESRAGDLEAEADMIEVEAEVLEVQAETIESRIEDIERLVEEIRERAEEAEAEAAAEAEEELATEATASGAK